jgi:hypothetical protein
MEPIQRIDGSVEQANSLAAHQLGSVESPTQDPPGQLVMCSVGELRPHSSYVRHSLSVQVAQLSALASRGELAFREPIVITRDRTIVDGYARWNLAQQQGRTTLPCIEYDLTEDEALHRLIQCHRGSRGLNAFSRVLLALDLEPSLREKSRSNQRTGGQHKGSSSLTEAQRMDVRSELATAAGVSLGNVTKVKQLVKSAHASIQQALTDQEISIHLAWQWSSLSAQQQLKALEKHRSRKGTNQTSRRLIQKHVARLVPTQLVPTTLGDLLKSVNHDGWRLLDSVAVCEIDAPGNVAYCTKDALRTLKSLEKPG